ncbi:hypothetical protein COK06_16240 [Bacillus cereus]|uniref:hypothetical protein n=1 Tax=Bacillus nitratireducens TaxID=2026193 RepID=UPI000BF27C6F|nr:hypothetical protein [Bacillus nitratireducens]PFA35185.1 hypothetical protein CN390_05305 [Bacillus cereus]PFE54221.1 hypothetical protein CN318_18305 [Bacillus cereus]PFI40801.1 hypothetical protein COI72_09260 [Bacillus cereus]PFP95910.1 hypothetical protein COK06_16240 [Bacillus cereus]PGO97943.1 hypothetical protein CN996_25690 [Bacillus cereus]
MKSIEKIVDSLTADNLEEGKALLKNHILLMKYGMEHHELKEEEMTKILKWVQGRDQLREDVPELPDLHLVKKFQAVLDEFIHSIISNGYVEDAVEILESVLKSMGAVAHIVKIMFVGKMTVNRNSLEMVEVLKRECYNLMEQRAAVGLHAQIFHVLGFVHSIQFDLEERSQEHGRTVIGFLTDFKTKELKSVQQFQNEEHISEVKNMVSKEYGIELQRRIYMWKSLTLIFTNPYALEKMYKEIYAENEKTEKEQKKK